MGGPRIRAALLASREAIRSLIYPEGACDAEGRRIFAQETREANARVLYWLAGVLTPLCVATIAVFVGRPQRDPAHLAWQLSMGRIVATVGALGVGAAIVARWGRPAALFRALGDVMGSVHVLCAAAMSANAQRVHPNLTVFVISAIGTSFFLRMTPGVFALSLAAGAGLVIDAMQRFQVDVFARRVDGLSVVGVVVLSLFSSLLSRSMRVRVLLARRQIEVLNGDLERRVEAQVGEIVQRAREIDELNGQLNEKIKERSRELSTALARLAEGNRGLAPGAVLGGRVEIEAWIGAGGMGVVYRGRDRVTNKTVAVKVIQAGSASELDDLYRFLREVQAMASVTHPAIVRSFHVDVSEEGLLFQMMELAPGEPLDAHLARAGSLSAPAAARLGAVLAEALAAAHAAGVVHRDVKPSNVMLTRAAPGLKLLDFGISKLREASAQSGGTGRILGTPEFVSPEQVSAPASVGAASDVYSLGVLLYLCVAGRLPFDAGSSRSFLLAHLVDAPVPLTSASPGVDPAVARAVMACLAKAPDERPTAAELGATLSKIADAADTPPLEALDLVLLSGPQSPDVASRTTVSRIADTTFRSGSRTAGVAEPIFRAGSPMGSSR